MFDVLDVVSKVTIDYPKSYSFTFFSRSKSS